MEKTPLLIIVFCAFIAGSCYTVHTKDCPPDIATGPTIDVIEEITIRVLKKLLNEQTVGKAWPSQLESPWRDTYVQNTPNKPVVDGCPFCHQIAAHEDATHLILKRTANFIVLLNKYPYCKGHLLIVPKAHLEDHNALDSKVRAELMDLIIESGETLKEQLHVTSYNAGCNIGKDAGASLPDHFHWHVLPRKANEGLAFIHTVAQTNIMPWDQNKLYQRLKDAFNRHSEITHNNCPVK